MAEGIDPKVRLQGFSPRKKRCCCPPRRGLKLVDVIALVRHAVEPDELAEEIAEDLQTALELFGTIAKGLKG
jgi:hypothetical protein